MNFEKNTLSDFNKSRSLEWIDTNGLGGYSSGTVSGAHSRRYHGLLVASLHPPVDRVVVVSKLDETIVTDEGRFELGANQYPGTVHPRGYNYLKSFERDLFPTFYYSAGGVELKKTIAAIHGENTAVILYEVIGGPDKFDMELLPLYACRDFHAMAHANESISKAYRFSNGLFSTRNYEGGPEFFIDVPNSTFKEQIDWYRNFEYAVEQYRGLEFQEDLFTHGKFSVALKKGDTFGVIISTENTANKEALKLFSREKKRREKVVSNFNQHPSLKRLAIAADQFIVKRGEHSTIIAGYHWFADWGRDTMISLPGLCLVTDRYNDAKEILKQFAESVNEGMLPNRFPDYGEAPEYNTIDATLWFFLAIYKYYEYTHDKAFIASIMPVLEDIINWHIKGTRYNIHVDPDDGLLYGGEAGVQLTWMDAKVGDFVVTPRIGKPVEINALWYNALCVMGSMKTELGQQGEADSYRTMARRVQESFNEQFWNEKQDCLYDYVNGNDKNSDMRPNQIYAVSLPFSLLPKEKALKVIDAVGNYLLTPKGLRSLSQSHKDYKPVYGGGVWSRDNEYHQGTVWSFLLGPYIDAIVATKGAKGKTEATRLLNKFFEHLDEAGVGTVSEIFDADPPNTARGCIAQAWGVAEVLRTATEHELIPNKKSKKISHALTYFL